MGDFGFLIGILTLWALTNTLNFSLMEMPAGISETLLNITVLCLFCGAVGKSAQFPLHVWLPDAMEGPTPVSALIHAATMVAAGVYMMVRVQLSIGVEAFPSLSCDVIAIIGAITAIIAAFMATQQNDIKRVLAYSTLSQLGYMVMALGLLAGEAAMFHLFTHAWFKALLFLGAGAIIFACHHEQDIWKMGGIMKRMKLTSLTFIIGTMALIAIPFTSGFFSKEAILEAALHKNPVFFWIGGGVALLTTFYMMRVIFVVFFGRERSHSAEHAREVGGVMLIPLLILAVLAVISGYGFIADRLVPFNGFAVADFHMGMPSTYPWAPSSWAFCWRPCFMRALRPPTSSPATPSPAPSSTGSTSTGSTTRCSLKACRAFWPPLSTSSTSSSFPASSWAAWPG